MSTIESQQLLALTQTVPIRRFRRWRLTTMAVAVIITILTATVAIGQSSDDFDLACRGIVASGGRVSTSSNFSIIGAMGIPIAPGKDSDASPTYAVRSADFAIRGGFLPGYPNGQSNRQSSGQNAVAAPAISEQIKVQRLPFISKIGAIIRGGC